MNHSMYVNNTTRIVIRSPHKIIVLLYVLYSFCFFPFCVLRLAGKKKGNLYAISQLRGLNVPSNGLSKLDLKRTWGQASFAY